MALTVVLAAVAILLIVSALSLLLHGTALGRILIYGGSLALCGIGLVVGLSALLGQAPPETLILPIGLPWLGAHFRLDALSAFFLVVVNLGGAAASLYALGFGRHETAPRRVLPFYPLFLAAMNLVVIADDAFTFLFSWEFMSLSSWALVMAHDHVARELARGLCLSGDGELRHARACCSPSACLPGPTAPTPSTRSAPAIRSSPRRARAHPRPGRHRLQGWPRAAACLAAARPPGGAEPRLRPVERRHDQGRGLRLRPHRVRPRWAIPPGGGAWWCSRSPASPASWACSTR